MLISITYIKLKKLRYYFRLSLWGLKITRQASDSPGLIKQKNTGFGFHHYTLSVWESAGEMKNFSSSGIHADAVRNSAEIGSEFRFYTYKSDYIPSWNEAKELIKTKGRLYKPAEIS